jgi:hypothetical protein
MTEQIKAEAYVREQRPALMELTFGCEVEWNGSKEGFTRVFMGYSEEIDYGTKYAHIVSTDYEYRKGKKWSSCITKTEMLKPIGHPIQLNDWLAVLGKIGVPVEAYVLEKGLMEVEVNYEAKIYFNLTTGQPNSESDYKAFNEITSI